jgi:AraC-like DNA-binding protein
MGVAQMIDGYRKAHPDNQSDSGSASDHSLLPVVTGFLDAALRMWDDNHIQAKSQIKVAAALLRDYSDNSAAGAKQWASASDVHGLAPWQTRKVREFIEASLDSTIRLRDCASEARLSGSYFSHAFKATFGTTVCQYIRCRRVERAQQLMLVSTDTLSQIALACGFADQAHYSRVFRGVVGLSPNAWRRRNMKLSPDE